MADPDWLKKFREQERLIRQSDLARATADRIAAESDLQSAVAAVNSAQCALDDAMRDCLDGPNYYGMVHLRGSFADVMTAERSLRIATSHVSDARQQLERCRRMEITASERLNILDNDAFYEQKL